MKLEITTGNDEKIQVPEDGFLSSGILAKLLGYDESSFLQILQETDIPTIKGKYERPDHTFSTKFSVKDFPKVVEKMQEKALSDTISPVDTTKDFRVVLPDGKSTILFLYEKSKEE